MSRRRQLLARLRREAAYHPVAAAHAASTLRRIGARQLAVKFDHTLGRGDDELFELCPRRMSEGQKPFRMHRAEGTDQIVLAIEKDGWNAFEAPLPDAFGALVAADPGEVLDVGANSGFYALLAASVDRKVRVHAFEPYPPAVAWLRRNLEVNERGGNIVVVEQAVGAEPGGATLFVPTAEHQLLETSCSLNPTFKDAHSAPLEVEVVTLDGFVAGRQLHRVSLVKIDVESMEHHVLAGASTILDRDRPVVVVEVLPKGNIDALEEIRDRHRLIDVRLRRGQAVVGQPVAFDPDAWNHLFLPAERLDQALGQLREMALDVTR